jgi:hypothetical protein
MLMCRLVRFVVYISDGGGIGRIMTGNVIQGAVRETWLSSSYPNGITLSLHQCSVAMNEVGSIRGLEESFKAIWLHCKAANDGQHTSSRKINYEGILFLVNSINVEVPFIKLDLKFHHNLFQDGW